MPHAEAVSSPPTGPASARGDSWVAACVALPALAIYWRTLYPGLVGDGDTPKFQYVGAILGTPHNPGYPLYVLVSHLFSRLPIGNLAWRINLLSALAAALAVALVYLLARRLGAGRVVSAATAWAAACGPVFWSQATLAEVYTLAAALQLGVLLPLVAWGQAQPRAPHPRGARSAHEGRLWAAAGVFALALGHHLTIVTTAPALVAYALWRARGAVLRPRLLGGLAALLALGLGQYLLILVRTRQGAAYLGSTARDLGELVDVVRGAQFADRLLAYGAARLFAERLPLVGGVIAGELGAVGLVCLALGVWTAARRAAGELALLLGAAAGVLLFALNYRVDDTDVFLVPALVLLWPLAAVGLQRLVERLAGRVPPALLSVACCLWPAGQALAHWRANDHSQRTFEGRFFRALFEHLPARGVLLAESYTVDQMALYELHGEGYAARKQLRLGPRDPETVAAYAGQGRPLFALGRAHAELAAAGHRFVPLALHDAAGALPRGPWPVFRLSGLPECVALGDGAWHDVTAPARAGRLLVRLDNYDVFAARFELEAWAPEALEVRWRRLAGRGRPRVERLESDARAAALDRPAGSRRTHLELTADDGGDFVTLVLELQAVPLRARARARVDRPEARRALACHLALGEE